ncbi:hypothetical protein NLX86_06735 [Streptomyces sp. A3M-1-3]|uniref:hypothetical protein n=1 Tax=Streptomyces sp. A3M-1-3 TaxID=2962044 RepID=UPI0020B7440D|nr:hypothetical protein [Streptomyces sp. A3M-1-3]MCP3817843.1 hypothetical protein [Streptomyces sp. A3M-1-3]
MPIPAGVEKVTVSNGEPLTLPDGTLLRGRLTFTAPDLVTLGSDDFTFGGATPVDLVDGTFSVALVATDATGMSPTGWTYKVTAAFSNAPGWTRYISLPKATPTVVLADVLVPDPVAGTFSTLVLASSITPASIGAYTQAAGEALETGKLDKVGGTLTGAVTVNRALATDVLLGGLVGAEGFDRMRVLPDRIEFGPGTATRDTNWRRSAANEWTTDDAVIVSLMLRHLGTTLGFYGAAAAAKPAVTGSRGGNAAVASLLSALATLGLITDNSTA